MISVPSFQPYAMPMSWPHTRVAHRVGVFGVDLEPFLRHLLRALERRARVFFLAEPLQGVAQISMSQRARCALNRTFLVPDRLLEIPAAIVNGAEV